MPALVLTHFVNGHDVRMIQPGGGFGFGAEALDLAVIGEAPGQNHLERHDPVEAGLSRPPHRAHAAVGDFSQQFVVAELK